MCTTSGLLDLTCILFQSQLVVTQCGLRCNLTYLLLHPRASQMTHNSGLRKNKHKGQHVCKPEVLGSEQTVRQISEQWGTELMLKCFSLSLFPSPLPKWMVLKYISCGFSEISADLSNQPPAAVNNSIRHLRIGFPSFSMSLPPLILGPWDHTPQKVLTRKPCLKLCGNRAKAGTS